MLAMTFTPRVRAGAVVDVPPPAPDIVPLPPSPHPIPPAPETPPEIIEPPSPGQLPPVRDPIVGGGTASARPWRH